MSDEHALSKEIRKRINKMVECHKVETMAYVGEKPWHGLGAELPEGATPRQMMKAAKLDWKVIKAPLYAAVGDKQVAVDDYFALVRNSDNTTLSVCGPDYIPIQNEEIFKFFAKYCEAGKMKMETAGSLRQGRHIWALANLGEGFTLAGGDMVKGYLLFSQPHEYGKAWTIKFTPVRVVCQNTITLALRTGTADGTFRRTHLGEFDAKMIEDVETTLGLAHEMLGEFEEKAKLLTEAKVTDPYAVNRYIAELFQPELLAGESLLAAAVEETGSLLNQVVNETQLRIEPQQFKRNASLVREMIERSPGATMESADGTWWGVMNAATYVIDHKLGRDRDNAMYRAWFGDNAGIKRKAFENAIVYAERELAR